MLALGSNGTSSEATSGAVAKKQVSGSRANRIVLDQLSRVNGG
jgi:hypothetical protein